MSRSPSTAAALTTRRCRRRHTAAVAAQASQERRPLDSTARDDHAAPPGLTTIRSCDPPLTEVSDNPSVAAKLDRLLLAIPVAAGVTKAAAELSSSPPRSDKIPTPCPPKLLQETELGSDSEARVPGQQHPEAAAVRRRLAATLKLKGLCALVVVVVAAGVLAVLGTVMAFGEPLHCTRGFPSHLKPWPSAGLKVVLSCSAIVWALMETAFFFWWLQRSLAETSDREGNLVSPLLFAGVSGWMTHIASAQDHTRGQCVHHLWPRCHFIGAALDASWHRHNG